MNTATTLWVPAVNAEARFGRWAFFEVTDPWDSKAVLADFLLTQAAK